jgi:D-glycero-D-manno-heptose 1,7-bisphosphate phosphatase
VGKRGKIKAIFIDLDGVILKAINKNGFPYSVKSLEDAIVLPGVEEGLKISQTHGFLNIVITNQPDISRGTYLYSDFERLRKHLLEELSLDEIYVCPHDDQDECNCRKPKPGMIEKATSDFEIDLPSSYVIGDRWKDIECAQRLSLDAFWLDWGYAEKKPNAPFTRVKSLFEAIELICHK